MGNGLLLPSTWPRKIAAEPLEPHQTRSELLSNAVECVQRIYWGAMDPSITSDLEK